MSSITDKMGYLIPRPIRDTTRSENWVKLSIRLSVLVAGLFCVNKYGHRGLVLLAGATVSLPATLMGVGATVLYKGIQMIGSNWSKLAFEGITNGLALTVAGYYILENYKAIKMFDLEKREESYNPTGRGLLEDYMSRLGGNWVFLD